MLDSIPSTVNLIIPAVFIGIGATAIMDIWAIFLKSAFGVTSLNYAMVGRWIGHMVKGKLMHQSIGQSPKIIGEAIIGWSAHYIIGVIFAITLILIWGQKWLSSPSMIPALVLGFVTVVFPFLLIQPCFGMGVAATKLRSPHINQIKSIAAHLVFGIGLFLSGLLGRVLLWY